MTLTERLNKLRIQIAIDRALFKPVLWRKRHKPSGKAVPSSRSKP